MGTPLILVTNDDGVHAKGIRALARGLAPLGDVRIVAPDREVSACGQSLTITRALRSTNVEPDVFAVDGTPADCVNLAVVRLLGQRPDLVVSGINRGPNLGEDVYYSGTVGGAREACFFGIPAIAMSLVTRSDADYGPAAAFAALLAALVIEKRLPERTLLNVNVPLGRPTRVAMTVQGRRQHEALIQDGVDPRIDFPHWNEIELRDPWREGTISDMEAVRIGVVSVTPLQTDATHYASLEAFRPWVQKLSEGQG
jgi:5'-nucleotidase